MFRKFDINFDKEKFLSVYSPNWYETYRSLGLPKENWKIADELWVKEAEKKNTIILPDTIKTLINLSEKFSLAIVTSGSKSRVERDLKNNNIQNIFKVIITGDDIKNRKPHPEGLENALEKMNVNNEDAVYIGDAKDDLKMAQSAGIDFIGINSDFDNLKDDGTYPILNRITEISNWLVK